MGEDRPPEAEHGHAEDHEKNGEQVDVAHGSGLQLRDIPAADLLQQRPGLGRAEARIARHSEGAQDNVSSAACRQLRVT